MCTVLRTLHTAALDRKNSTDDSRLVCIGGWWTRPANWKANTGIVAAAMGLLTYTVWKFSAEREVRAVC